MFHSLFVVSWPLLIVSVTNLLFKLFPPTCQQSLSKWPYVQLRFQTFHVAIMYLPLLIVPASVATPIPASLVSLHLSGISHPFCPPLYYFRLYFLPSSAACQLSFLLSLKWWHSVCFFSVNFAKGRCAIHHLYNKYCYSTRLRRNTRAFWNLDCGENNFYGNVPIN